MPTIEGAGVPLSYEQYGDRDATRAAVLLIHDIASDALALHDVASGIASAGLCAIAYDRRGYGASGAPEPYDGTTVAEQSRDAVALLGGLDAAPAVVAGDGWGALIALELLLREPALVSAVVVRDPLALVFVPEATEELSRQRAMLEQALTQGGPTAGVRAWLGDRGDEAARDRAAKSHRAFFADYAGLASWVATRAELRAIVAPLAIVCGSRTPPVVRAAAAALAQRCPTATRSDDGDLTAAVIATARRSTLGP